VSVTIVALLDIKGSTAGSPILDARTRWAVLYQELTKITQSMLIALGTRPQTVRISASTKKSGHWANGMPTSMMMSLTWKWKIEGRCVEASILRGVLHVSTKTLTYRLWLRE